MNAKTKSHDRGFFNKRNVLVAFAVVALLVAGGYAFAKHRQNGQTTADLPADEHLNLNPATPQDHAESDQNKQSIVDQQNSNNSNQTHNGLKQVTPVITSAGQYPDTAMGDIELRAFIPGIFEAGGKCKATFTKAGASAFVREVDALQDATTTRCDTIAIQRKNFPGAGTWDVVIAYTSAKSQGTSDKFSFEVK